MSEHIPDPLPTFDVSITVETGGATQVHIDGVDVSWLLLEEDFAVHLGRCKCCGMPEPSVTLRLPVGKLALDMPDAILRVATGIDEVA